MDHMRPQRIVEAAAGLVQAGTPLEEVHRQVITAASAAVPAPSWQAIAGISTRRDTELLAQWISEQLHAPTAPADLTGLWFGLYETRPEPDGPARAVLELAGWAGFPHDQQWLQHLNWRPGTAPAPGLGQLLPLAAADPPEAYELAGYAVVLAYAMALSMDAVEAAAACGSLTDRPLLAIAVGFHDGDIALLGTAHHGQTTRSAITWI